MPHIAVEGAKEDWFSTCPLLPNRQRGRYTGTTQTMSQGIWIRRRDWKETSKQTTLTPETRVVTLRLSTAHHPSAITVHNNIRATATLFAVPLRSAPLLLHARWRGAMFIPRGGLQSTPLPLARTKGNGRFSSPSPCQQRRFGCTAAEESQRTEAIRLRGAPHRSR